MNSTMDNLRQILARAALRPETGMKVDFNTPVGEESLAPAGSVAWRIFKNPVALFIGGINAVIMELAEPRVRAGVWDHTKFRINPIGRMERTGLAAMVTVYAARSVAEEMIARVNRIHARVKGKTPEGESYSALDPELIEWVHATASFGFLEAYRRFVRPISDSECDRYYAEGVTAACLYGAKSPPASQAEIDGLFRSMGPRLRRNDTVFEFLDLVHAASIFPWPLQSVQSLLIRAAVEITPFWVREILDLGPPFGLSPLEPTVVWGLGRLADQYVIPWSPPAEACRRLGLTTAALHGER